MPPAAKNCDHRELAPELGAFDTTDFCSEIRAVKRLSRGTRGGGRYERQSCNPQKHSFGHAASLSNPYS